MPESWRRALAVYADRRVISIFFFGFSSGLPLLLIGPTLAVWLREEGVSLTEIGFLSLVAMAYALKFLWAPLVDRLSVPGVTRLLGRRRSWLLVSQVALMLSVAALGHTDPSRPQGRFWTVALAALVAFVSATQDIVVDAYRTEILERRKLGAGAATVQFGYRLGMLVASAGCLVAADAYGWTNAYTLMAALVMVGIVATLVNPEPQVATCDPSSRGDGDAKGGILGHLTQTVLAPFLDLLRRPGWLAILAFTVFYKYADSLLGVMANPFYIDMGFTKTEIGLVSKVFGVVMTLLGTAVAGVVVARLGIYRALLLGAVAQGASNFMFVVQALVGHDLRFLAATIAVENISGGVASGAFVAYLSSLCNVRFTATQYALLSSLAAFSYRIFASIGGVVADQVSWPVYFGLTVLGAVPGIFLLLLVMRRYRLPD